MADTEQRILEQMSGLTGTSQSVLTRSLGFSENQLSPQEALNVAAGRNPGALTTEEALRTNITSAGISLNSTYRYTEQELLDAARAGGLVANQLGGFSPITITKMADVGNTTDASSYAFPSVSFAANKLYIAAVSSYLAATNVPTMSSATLTWTAITNQTIILGGQRTTLFRAMPSSPVSEVATADWAGQVQNAFVGAIFQFDNVLTTGTNGADAIGTFASGTAISGSTSVTQSLSALTNNKSAVFATNILRLNQSQTVSDTFTEMSDTGVGSPNFAMATAFKAFPASSVTFNWTTSEFPGIIAVEIKHA
jgi:hypothetical protein